MRSLGIPPALLTLLSIYVLSARGASDSDISASNSTLSPDSSPLEWPYNLPKHVKYWPEDPPHRRRDLEAVNAHLQSGDSPLAIKKMTTDEGEKFFPEYWAFGPGSIDDQIYGVAVGQARAVRREPEQNITPNVGDLALRAPYALHTFEYQEAQAGRQPRDSSLTERGYQCPSGTSSCSDIGYPNSCCATGETCFEIEDTGLGSIGCCPTGSTCSGSVSTCASGYTACADNLGGGCCIPGYVCEGVGCVASGVVTVISTQYVTVVGSSTTEVVTATVVGTTTQSETTTTVLTGTGLQTTLVCSSSYRACPVSLGGGCCLSDRLCGATDCPASSSESSSSTSSETTGTSSSSATGVAPVRPTSATTTSTTTSGGSDTCPTGYYACSAYYGGGCCRTGRDCSVTDCPATSSTTLVSNGETIVVPLTGSATTTAAITGSCADGWFSCAATLGGDCCPSGFSCGTASCSTVSNSATAVIGKGATENAAPESKPRWWFALGAVLVAISIG